jgi:hypothetical protein
MNAVEKLASVDLAINLLKNARSCLKNAGAEQTLKRVRSALRSAEGARRNAERFAAKEARR